MRVVSRGMFFGRFQPFHKGHLEVARMILEEHDELVFLIGMATESHTHRNPFTAGERIEMIRRGMRDAGVGLERVITATLHTMEIHVSSAHMALNMVPPVDAVYVGNRIMARVFRELGVKVVMPQPVKRGVYNASYIRSLMARGDPRWRELVSPSVAEYLLSIGAEERMRGIMAPDEEHVLEKEGM